MVLAQKFTISKKSSIFALSSSNLVKITMPRGNCYPRLENSRLQTGHFETPRFQCSELQRLD